VVLEFLASPASRSGKPINSRCSVLRNFSGRLLRLKSTFSTGEGKTPTLRAEKSRPPKAMANPAMIRKGKRKFQPKAAVSRKNS